MQIGILPVIFTFISGSSVPITLLTLLQFNSFFAYSSFLNFNGGNIYNFINNLEGIKYDYDSQIFDIEQKAYQYEINLI